MGGAPVTPMDEIAILRVIVAARRRMYERANPLSLSGAESDDEVDQRFIDWQEAELRLLAAEGERSSEAKKRNGK